MEEYSALIPRKLNRHIKTPRGFHTFILICVFIFLLFYLLIHVLRFDKHFWSGTRILEILFNITILQQPHNWSERFIFFCLTILSINFVIVGISLLTEIQFKSYDDVAYKNLAIMGKQGFTPIILEQFRDITLEDEIEEDEAFKARLQVARSPEDCSIRLERGEKIVCFMTRFIGESLIQKYLLKKEEPKMKLMPYLWSSWKVMLFERGSPFVEGFNRMLRRLKDSGLMERFVYDVTYNRTAVTVLDKREILKQIITPGQLMAELFVGYLIASLVLMIELAIHRLRKDVNRYRIHFRIA